METYDREHESERLAATVQAAVAGTAALQVGALGLGTIVTVLASSAAVDVTGILAAGSLSVLGLLVLPARRSGAKAELREKVETMRVRLMGALETQFARELESSLLRIREAIGPYTRFVRSERERLGALREELAAPAPGPHPTHPRSRRALMLPVRVPGPALPPRTSA